jgi:hypothetical protein
VSLEGRRAILKWSTASETNNAGFEVHHLTRRSGQTFWDVVGFVDGHGTLSTPSSYLFEVDDLSIGVHGFRLKQIDFDGRASFSPKLEAVVEVPGNYFLSDAYPNPFNPRSYFSVAVPKKQKVIVSLHDAVGRLVRTLFEGELPANEQRWITVDGTDLSSGIYFYKVMGQTFSESKTVVLQK